MTLRTCLSLGTAPKAGIFPLYLSAAESRPPSGPVFVYAHQHDRLRNTCWCLRGEGPVGWWARKGVFAPGSFRWSSLLLSLCATTTGVLEADATSYSYRWWGTSLSKPSLSLSLCLLWEGRFEALSRVPCCRYLHLPVPHLRHCFPDYSAVPSRPSRTARSPLLLAD